MVSGHIFHQLMEYYPYLHWLQWQMQDSAFPGPALLYHYKQFPAFRHFQLPKVTHLCHQFPQPPASLLWESVNHAAHLHQHNTIHSSVPDPLQPAHG